MTHQHFSFWLILLMVLTPVTSVFGHYPNITDFLSAERIRATAHSGVFYASAEIPPALVKTLPVADLANDHAQTSSPCQSHNNAKIFCYANGSCGSHSCGDGGVIAVFLFTQACSAYRYRHLENIPTCSVAVSPEIKPPI